MIYNRFVIDSTDYTDVITCQIKSSIGENNSASSFTIKFNNEDGEYSDTFSIGDSVEVYADIDSSPATTKIFNGLIENIEFGGKGNDETIILSGENGISREYLETFDNKKLIDCHR